MVLYGSFNIFAGEPQMNINMQGKNCPNYINCQLVHKEEVLPDKKKQGQYIRDYCLAGKEAWGQCKRYLTKKELNFCPDFVLPDSPWSPDEILDILEEREMNDFNEQ